MLSCTYAQLGLASIVGGLHAAPTATHSLVNGQHTSVALAHGDLAPQKTPGLVGVRQCLASGQQYSVAAHCGVGTHALPGVTQILVRGQQTSPAEHAFAFFASGQEKRKRKRRECDEQRREAFSEGSKQKKEGSKQKK